MYYIALSAGAAKKLTELQFNAQFVPSVTLSVSAKQDWIGSTNYCEIRIIYKNNTNYSIIIDQKIDFFWFDVQIENKDHPRTVILPPYSPILIKLRITDGKTSSYALEYLKLITDDSIWLDHIRNPLYFEIKYTAKNEYLSQPQSAPFIYNIRFETGKIIELIPEVSKTYKDNFSKPGFDKTEYIQSCILYAHKSRGTSGKS